MENTKTLQVILVLSGLIGVIIGLLNLFVPVEFAALSDIQLGDNNSLLSETRAPGAALVGLGALIIAGAFHDALRFTATVVATILYLFYGLGRLWSMAIDGMPHEALVQAAVGEVIIGLICLFMLCKYRRIATQH